MFCTEIGTYRTNVTCTGIYKSTPDVFLLTTDTPVSDYVIQVYFRVTFNNNDANRGMVSK